MKLISLTILGALLVTVLFVAPMVTHLIDTKARDELPWNCSTDQECTDECLRRCVEVVECRSCWDVFIGLEAYEYYLDKIDYLDN